MLTFQQKLENAAVLLRRSSHNTAGKEELGHVLTSIRESHERSAGVYERAPFALHKFSFPAGNSSLFPPRRQSLLRGTHLQSCVCLPGAGARVSISSLTWSCWTPPTFVYE